MAPVRILILIGFALGCACFAGGSTAEPYAEWLDTANLDDVHREQVLKFRTSKLYRVPAIDEVTIRKYPDARMFMAELIAESDSLPSVVLVSKSSPRQVADWYRRQLPTFSYFDIEIDGRRKSLLILGCDSFDIAKHSHLFATNPHVIVSDVAPSLRSLTEGYQTMIEIVYERSNQPE